MQVPKMQGFAPAILHTPSITTVSDLTYILSLTGVTRLKAIPQKREVNGVPVIEDYQPFMKNRHGASKAVEINAVGKISLKEKRVPAVPGKKIGLAVPVQTPKQILTENEDTNNVDKKGFSVNKKEIRRRIQGMINAQKYGKGVPKLFFITVSFPENISDVVGYRLLNTWLTRLRKWRKKMSYLWVAERQKNGTIHFHIAVPHFLNVRWANSFMRAAIITQIKKGNIDWNIHAAKKYNGVDIAGKKYLVNGKWKKDVTNFALEKKGISLANYLSKYVTKNDATFQHAAWRCSHDFSALVHTVNCTGQELKKSQLACYLDRSNIRETDFFYFAFWLHPPWKLYQYFSFLNYSILQLIGSPAICEN